MRFKAIVAVCAILVLAVVVPPAHAQSISTADLAGTWSVFQLATPATNVTGGSIRSYSGTLTFADTGLVTAGTLTDDQPRNYTVTGQLTLTATGLLQGTLALDGGLNPSGTLEVRGARALANKFTIVGAASILGQVGLFTFVKADGQVFSLNEDIANDGDGTGNYAYHEVTPSDQGPGTVASGDASWSTGSITFHENDGCTAADLRRADGSIRAQRSDGATSFG